MSIKEALLLKNVKVKIDDFEVELRRPSVLDLVEAANQKEDNIAAWLVYNHLLENGEKVFSNIDEVYQSDALLVEKIAKAIDGLYGEGRD